MNKAKNKAQNISPASISAQAESESVTTEELESSAIEAEANTVTETPKEYGGRKDGLDPTRYGDWEKNGRCIDF